ncbi:DUF935 family protein [Ohtaekwangia kribbensis]|uniref:DUF935 family protein n=1 Tax=Ohtaekwangia kribbensis TaxID=688913 RepID=A0ABW3JWY4_9BACT
MRIGRLQILKSIPDKFLPKALTSEQRAVDQLKKTKRISAALVKRRNYIAEMKQDELKLAIEYAEDPIRPRRDLLYEIYRRCVEGDGHFMGEYEKAINKVVGAPFGLFPIGSDADAKADPIKTRLLKRNWFEEYVTYHEEGVFYGHSLIQFLDMVASNIEGVKFEFSTIDLIDREHVRPEDGYIVIEVSDEKGIPFRDPAIAKAARLIEIGKPRNLGKLKVIAKEYIWKNYSRSDWSRHSEKFGMPFIQIKTDTTNETELKKTEEMAANFGSNLWFIGDSSDEIEIKEASFKDSYQIYREKALFCNDEMSKATTWQTGTSDEKAFVGSSEVHADILDDYTEWRKRKVTYHVNDVLIPFLIENGYPLQGYEFRYLTYKETNPEEENKEDQQQGAGGQNPAKKSDAQQRAALYKYMHRTFARR